jgi:tRNA (guanosine-2'-O-)-methyltransferase
VSVSLCLQHLTYKLRKASFDWKMTEDEKDGTMLQWLRNSIKSSAQIEEKYLNKHTKK